jgi:hypothetical protein
VPLGRDIVSKTYKTVQKEVQEEESITCNQCGKPINSYWDTFISIEKKWAYGTEWDGETHSFDLCEQCYRELIAKFTVAPTRSE